ncbi:MAG: FKBP-type peptidyl-prolyl cis-trans isomerase [Pseudohongiellaceae bacterium]
MLNTLTLTTLCMLLLSSPLWAQGVPDLEDEDQRVAYSLGANIGKSLLQQQEMMGDVVDVEALISGLRDIKNGESRLSDEEITETLIAYQQRVISAAERKEADNLADSEAFLAENAMRDGVVVLESGLQYEILESGPAGNPSPTVADSVLAHYHGTLADGSVFDSSVERDQPARFALTQVIRGWTEGLQLMRVGDKWRLYIPSEMAYGASPPTPAIPPHSALIFEVELLEIN